MYHSSSGFITVHMFLALDLYINHLQYLEDLLIIMYICNKLEYTCTYNELYFIIVT